VTADVQERRIINLITPETGTTSHYFWCIARNYQLLDDAVSQKLRQDVVFTFDQDKALLEAQQRAVGNETNPTFPLAIMVDAGPIQGRRLLRTLVEAEQSASRPSA
jgi:phenylpropionate dioxygenase-like ring-hydroxylating dioxygenase large terminal subunit